MNASGTVVIVIAAVALVVIALFGLRFWLARRDVHVFRVQAGLAWVIPSYDEQGRATRVLRVAGANQSATYVDDWLWAVPVSPYIKRFELVFDAAIPVRDVLMLGGGGHSFPKLVVSAHPQARIDVVEIDPRITAIARRYFFLDRLIVQFDTEATGRLGLIEADALSFLREHEGLYDAIVNDTFAGKHPARDLMTPAALALIASHLRPGGIYVTNVVSPLEGPGSEVLRQTVSACEQEFSWVTVVSCTTGDPGSIDNRLVVASDVEQHLSHPGQRL